MATAKSPTPDPVEPPFQIAGSLDGIFNPKSLALIASGTDATVLEARQALLNGAYRGRVVSVGSGSPGNASTPVYSSVEAMPSDVDLALALAPPDEAQDIFAQCVRKRVKGVVLASAGSSHQDNVAAEASRNLQEILRGSRTRLIGPDSLGVAVPSLALNATAGLPMPLGGTVAFLCESLLLGRFVLDWSLKHIVGFNAFACLGSMLDVCPILGKGVLRL